MQAYDVFMLLVIAGAVVWGAWKGLAWQVASIASLGLSYFVAVNFRSQVAGFFHYQPPEFNNLLAMLVLYVGTTLVVWVGFNMLRDFLEKLQLKEFDRQVGGLLGLAKGLLICIVITLFTVGLGTESQRQAVIQSKSGYYLTQFLIKVEPLVPMEYRKMVDDAIARLEDRNGMPRGSYANGTPMPSSNWGWGTNQAAGGWGGNGTSGGYSNNWNTNNWNGTSYNTQASATSDVFSPENIRAMENELLNRLQQSTGNRSLFTPENVRGIQAELQARLQQGANNGGLFTAEHFQQLQNELLARLQQANQPPPNGNYNPPANNPPPRGWGS